MSRRRARKRRIMRLFPQLRSSHFRISSHPTAAYNCIAWAAGASEGWWEYRRGYYWPPGVPRVGTVAAAIQTFESLGFEQCASNDLEPGFTKVAIYGDTAGYTHAARQLDDGKWASKIGKLEDIEHVSLGDLVGSAYGDVAAILKKPWPPATE